MNTTDHFWRPIRNAISFKSKPRTALAVTVVVVLGVVVIAAINPGSKVPTTTEKSSEKDETDRGASVKLSGDKLRAAQLHIAPCQMRELSDLRTVPGKITYNESQ